MNCKPGDLAVIVRSEAGNEGKIVRCIRLIGDLPWYGPNGHVYSVATWEIDQVLASWKDEKSNLICDDQLRPIRDPGEDATDEVVALLGKPSSLPQPSKEHA